MSKKKFVSQGCNFEMDTLLDGKPVKHFEGWRDIMMTSERGYNDASAFKMTSMTPFVKKTMRLMLQDEEKGRKLLRAESESV